MEKKDGEEGSNERLCGRCGLQVDGDWRMGCRVAAAIINSRIVWGWLVVQSGAGEDGPIDGGRGRGDGAQVVDELEVVGVETPVLDVGEADGTLQKGAQRKGGAEDVLVTLGVLAHVYLDRVLVFLFLFHIM